MEEDGAASHGRLSCHVKGKPCGQTRNRRWLLNEEDTNSPESCHIRLLSLPFHWRCAAPEHIIPMQIIRPCFMASVSTVTFPFCAAVVIGPDSRESFLDVGVRDQPPLTHTGWGGVPTYAHNPPLIFDALSEDVYGSARQTPVRVSP